MAQQDWINNFKDMFAQARELLPKIQIKNIPAANMDLAKRHLERGNMQDAILRYRIVLWLQPRNADALTGMGIAYMMNGEDAKAENALRRALTIAPGNPPAVAALEELRKPRQKPEAAAPTAPPPDQQ